ncbi:MAG: ABC transporter substrate-binding protein [Oscillospiraceae bacterium]|nr:ABC transporter substrate-binding protein [Oscillospiraceae bacterium]
MKKRFLICLLAAAVVLSGCDENKENTSNNSSVVLDSQSSVGSENSSPDEENYDGKLVFDHSMELKYAKNFSVDYYKGGYKQVKTVDGTELLIVPENMSVPEGISEKTIVLQQPINNILVSSTPTISLINDIGALDSVTLTTSDVDSWYIDNVKDAFKSGKMAYVGDYSAPNYELIASTGTKFSIFSTMLLENVAAQFEELGVAVMAEHSSKEDHPLARVEWIKLYGAMFNKEAEAEEKFEKQAAYIDDIAKRENTGKTVAVFYITSSGKLYARNAGDYMSKMVELAGGKYVLSDLKPEESGTTNMEFEAFFDRAKDADYIIYVWSMGGRPSELSDFLGKSEILADMKAVKNNNVWCTTPDFFQISNTLGNMVNDINLMLNADESTDKLTYLTKLK